MSQIIKATITTTYSIDEGSDGGAYSSIVEYDINAATMKITEENNEDAHIPWSNHSYYTEGHTLDLNGKEYPLKEVESSILSFSSDADEVEVLEYIFKEDEQEDKGGEIFAYIDADPETLLRLEKDAFYDMVGEKVTSQFDNIVSSSVGDMNLLYDSVAGEDGYAKVAIKANLIDFVMEVR